MTNLMEVLALRERKAAAQEELIQKYSCPVIGFSLNIPGPNKTGPLLDKAFQRGIDEIHKNFTPAACYREQNKAGNFYIAAVELEPLQIKKTLCHIENSHPLGRLFDFDVIGADFQKIGREQLGFSPRKCLLCPEDAFVCARSRAHSLEALTTTVDGILKESERFEQTPANLLGEKALRALLEELAATPKPGLVDRRNSGAHTDMDFFTFLSSATTIFPYLTAMAAEGYGTKKDGLKDLLPAIRSIGLACEKAMYTATGAINTHKGAIFSMGILAAACGYAFGQQIKLEIESICEIVKTMTEGLVKEQLGSLAHKDQKSLTKGEQLYAAHQVTGIRGEAESGFLSVRQISYPILKQCLQDRVLCYNDCLVQTLLHLIAATEDTNILGRVGHQGLSYAKKQAAEALAAGGMLTEKGKQLVTEMDQDFIQKNISPGGSADLLAVTIFFVLTEE